MIGSGPIDPGSNPGGAIWHLGYIQLKKTQRINFILFLEIIETF